jgi:pimeloyl-ACP methyl ester carboxylesterase
MFWVWQDLANTGACGIKLVEERIDYYEMAMKCFKLKTGVQPTVLTDSELKKLKLPLLYLVGENETMYNGNIAVNRINNVAPKIETELIPDTGHDLMFTHTEMVNNRILEFLKN